MKRFDLLRCIPSAFLALLLSAFSVFCAQSGPSKTMDENAIRQLLRDAVDKEKRAPGIVVGFIDAKGRTVVGYGKLKVGGTNQVNGDTIFEIGSISKVFTSLVLADMVQKGEVKLDDPISKYLPRSVKVPSRKERAITLADLATHTSGLPRLPSNLSIWHLAFNADNPYAKYTVEQMYDFLSGYTLPRDIGSQYEYSNYGAGLLGHILALKERTSYEEMVRQRICRPLGMTDTRIVVPLDLAGRFATGHNESLKPVSNWDIPTLAGAGALRSTVNDLLKFLAANLGFVQSGLKSAMETQHTPRHRAASPSMRVGLGWHIAGKNQKEVIWHNGGTGGFHSYIGLNKSLNRGVVVLANSAREIEDIGEVVIGFRDQHEVANIDLDLYNQYVGEYDFGKKGIFKVTRKGGHLFGQLNGQGPLEFLPESETEFFCKAVDAQITFEKDGTGAVTGIILLQGGAKLKAARVK